MKKYSINSRLNNGNNGDNISINCITIKSDLHKFTRVLFVLALIFGVCGMSFGMEKRVPNSGAHANLGAHVGGNIFNNITSDVVVTKMDDTNANVTYNNGNIQARKLQYDVKIEGKQLFNESFAGRVYVVKNNGNEYGIFKEYLQNNTYNVIHKNLLEGECFENKQYIFALVKFRENDNLINIDNVINTNQAVVKEYLIYCEDANSIVVGKYCHGLFENSEATEIEILSCGDYITNMQGMFYNCSSVENLKLDKLKTSNVTDMSYMFNQCSSLTRLNLSKLDTANVTNMKAMFRLCCVLIYLDLSNFNTQNVTDMSYMFHLCFTLEGVNLSSFDTSNVTNMSFMFHYCISLLSLNLSNFNTENVTDMCEMFQSCSNLTELDLSNFKTHKVTNMSAMFDKCYQNVVLNLSNFNTENVTKMKFMFKECSSLNFLDISKFNTDKVTNMTGMFQDCFQNNATLTCPGKALNKFINGHSFLNIPISVNICDDDKYICIVCKGYGMVRSLISKAESVRVKRRTSAKNISYNLHVGNNIIFKRKNSFENLSLKGKFAENDPNNMRVKYTPEYLKIKYLDLVHFEFRKPEYRIVEVYDCAGFTEKDDDNFVKYLKYNAYLNLNKDDIDKYIIARVTVKRDYEQEEKYIVYCSNANTIYTTMTQVLRTFGLFQDSEATKIEILGCGSNITNIYGIFSQCFNLTNLNLSKFNTNKVTRMSEMFLKCQNLTSLNLSKFNTSKVTNMSNMFQNCSSLTSLDLSNFDTSKVANMGGMFKNCSSLTSLDVSHFNTDKVIFMSCMFQDCSGLGNINFVGNNNDTKWNTSKVVNMNWMFSGCSSLTSLNLSNWNNNNVTYMSGMFSDCSSLTSLNLSNFNTEEVEYMINMFSGCSSLKSLNLSNFDTKNVTDMSEMFLNCTGLTSLDLSNFNTEKVENMSNMFANCFNVNASLICSGKTLDIVISEEKCTSLKIGAYVDVKPDNKNYICTVNREENNNPIVIKAEVRRRNSSKNLSNLATFQNPISLNNIKNNNIKRSNSCDKLK